MVWYSLTIGVPMAMKHRSSDLCRNQVEPGLKSRQQRSNFFKGHRFPNRKSETEIVKKSAAVPKKFGSEISWFGIGRSFSNKSCSSLIFLGGRCNGDFAEWRLVPNKNKLVHFTRVRWEQKLPNMRSILNPSYFWQRSRQEICKIWKRLSLVKLPSRHPAKFYPRFAQTPAPK